MDRVSVDLKHCYGIKSLKYDFDFSGNRKAYAIYAPNGAMKSSLALTFKDLSNAAAGAAPRDRIFPDRPTVANVTDQDGNPIENDRILVIESYDDEVCPDEKHGALLVDTKLREQYEALQAKVSEGEQTLLAGIKAQSKSKGDLETRSFRAYLMDTRLRAERFIVDKLNDQAFWESIASNQTWQLISRYKQTPDCDADIAATLDRVLIMTPENIHLNSFMYEPLIDMNEDRLKKLYQEVKALS